MSAPPSGPGEALVIWERFFVSPQLARLCRRRHTGAAPGPTSQRGVALPSATSHARASFSVRSAR